MRPFDVIVFNNGLHSLHWTEDKVPDERLRDTQRQIYLNFRAGAPQAKILWLSTTPHTAREKNAAGKVEALGALDPVVRRINRLTGEAMDAAGVPSMDSAVNPNGSMCAIEGITSPDGRVLGKMGHAERIGKDLYRNVPGDYDMGLFRSAAKYFK